MADGLVFLAVTWVFLGSLTLISALGCSIYWWYQERQARKRDQVFASAEFSSEESIW